jgi:hypothetical protein
MVAESNQKAQVDPNNNEPETIRSSPAKLEIITKCELCPFRGRKGCTFVAKKQCGCDRPELKYRYFGNLQEFGICKNCDHFIILNGATWLHYHRSYHCGFPYAALNCVAPLAKSIVKKG